MMVGLYQSRDLVRHGPILSLEDLTCEPEQQCSESSSFWRKQIKASIKKCSSIYSSSQSNTLLKSTFSVRMSPRDLHKKYDQEDSILRSQRFLQTRTFTATSRSTKNSSFVRRTWLDSPFARVSSTLDYPKAAYVKEAGILIQGWLEKCGHPFPSSEWLYVVLLENGTMSFYADPLQKKSKGCLELGSNVEAGISIQTNLEKKHVFIIWIKKQSFMFNAPTYEQMVQWISKLQIIGVTCLNSLNPLRRTVEFIVNHRDQPHQWKRYDDPTLYIHMEGYLLRRSDNNIHEWKIFYVRIEKGELRFYVGDEEFDQESVSLKNTVVYPGLTQCFDQCSSYFVLLSLERRIQVHLKAPNSAEMHNWMEALQEAHCALNIKKKPANTVSGLASVTKRAEELPLLRMNLVFETEAEMKICYHQRSQAVLLASCDSNKRFIGSQLVAINKTNIIQREYDEAQNLLENASFPIELSFVLPPYKSGTLYRSSRSKWKQSLVIISNNKLHYDLSRSVVASKFTDSKEKNGSWKSFSLEDCQLNLVKIDHRYNCFAISHFGREKIILQAANYKECIDWASIIYCSIRMATQGLTSGAIESLDILQFEF